MTTMDLNSDLGESFGAWRMGDDEAILRVVTSANVACGFHAGDPAGILATVRAAVAQGVTIGAHVAYPDLVGFGRRNMDVTSAELQADVMYQIGALQGLATAAGTRVRYVKPHGALYNTIAHDERQAKAVIAAVRAVDPTLVLVALAGAPLVQWARDAGLTVVGEAFADRAYTPEGTLVSRREKGAVLHDATLVAQRTGAGEEMHPVGDAVADEEVSQRRHREVGQDLYQRVDLILPAHRAQLQEGEAGMHGQHHDGAQQDEQHVVARLNGLHDASESDGHP